MEQDRIAGIRAPECECRCECVCDTDESRITHHASRIMIIMSMFLASCTGDRKESGVTFMVAEPGHFHAALVLKSMYHEVNPRVYVYAPEGPELNDFLGRVDAYRNRTENPAGWELKTYPGIDFFDRMLREKTGNVLILAGNNQRKTEYIGRAIENGINVYSDKPMAINSDDFAILEKAFKTAGDKGLLLYDIMTERFEISSILQKEFLQIPDIFGDLLPGTQDEPAVTKESVHHFFKFVSGTRLMRPAWFFDVEQEGDGLTDVTTHLIDLIQWTCFPEQIIDYHTDITINSSRRWNTTILPEQFNEITGLAAYPDFLEKAINRDTILNVACNGEINYRLKGVNVRVSVIWNYKPPEGGGDTNFSIMNGSRARLEIRQGPDQNFKPELYLVPQKNTAEYQDKLSAAVKILTAKYPGLSFESMNAEYHILIPESYRVGHEAHFAQVTRNFLTYLKNGNLPEWEVPNMLAKYWLATKAREIANFSEPFTALRSNHLPCRPGRR
ncbi:MAG: putative oxidoreductase C-terminal domain-containing protein [Bacteroidota bacterium]